MHRCLIRLIKLLNSFTISRMMRLLSSIFTTKKLAHKKINCFQSIIIEYLFTKPSKLDLFNTFDALLWNKTGTTRKMKGTQWSIFGRFSDCSRRNLHRNPGRVQEADAGGRPQGTLPRLAAGHDEGCAGQRLLLPELRGHHEVLERKLSREELSLKKPN